MRNQGSIVRNGGCCLAFLKAILRGFTIKGIIVSREIFKAVVGSFRTRI